MADNIVRKLDDRTWRVGKLTFDSVEAATLYAESRAPTTSIKSGKLPAWLSWGVITLIVLGIAQSCSKDKPAAREGSGFDDMDALFMCQRALKAASRDPEKADVPYVPNKGSSAEAYFVWNGATKLARMRNGLGLEVGVSASCTVSMGPRRINSLTLDGKSIL